MEIVSRGKKKKSTLGEDDRISRLPDGVLGDIVSLLPTTDGARTQVIASRWRHLWRSAPLNVDMINDRPPFRRRIPDEKISGILSSHLGPGRRFCIPMRYLEDDDGDPAAALDGWLRSPALEGLQELEFHYGLRHLHQHSSQMPPLPPSARRFSSTLRVASFGACGFPAGGGALHLPLLEKLSLMNVAISESSLHALLARCPPLQSLTITESIGCSRIRIVSSTLRSIGVKNFWGEIKLEQIIIDDAPCLERLLLFGETFRKEMVISVVSAPKLEILGQLPVLCPRLEFGATVFQGSCVVNSTMVVPNVKVLALTHADLSLDVVIDFTKCFPCLENLYIKMTRMYRESTKPRVTNTWRRKYQNLIGTFDIRLKKIAVSTYRGNKAHVNFVNFFVLNARALQSMVLTVDVSLDNKAWIERQHQLLQIENRASKAARIDFLFHFGWPMRLEYIWSDQVHDLSTTDPFVRFDKWGINLSWAG